MKSLSKNLIPFILMIVGSLLLLSTLFLPYTSAIGEYAEVLENMPDVVVYDELDITADDISDVSMIEYARIYGSMLDTYSDGIVNVVMIVIIGVFAFFTVLFSVFKKSVPAIVFSVLGVLVFLVQNWDFSDRGVAPSERYGWGIAYYMFFVAAIVVIAGAIWMIISKTQMKKESVVQNS